MSISPRFMSDDELLAICRRDQYRGSGPGGQKRNKTSNAVRLVHLPTGIHVTATETRSLKENKLHAIRRLRLKLAVELREPIEVATFDPPDWFREIRHNGKVEVSHRHPFYAPVMGLLLDVCAAMSGNPAAMGDMLGISTSTVIRLLEMEPSVWVAANQIRSALGMEPLTHRRG